MISKAFSTLLASIHYPGLCFLTVTGNSVSLYLLGSCLSNLSTKLTYLRNYILHVIMYILCMYVIIMHINTVIARIKNSNVLRHVIFTNLQKEWSIDDSGNIPGEEHWLLDTSLDEVYWPCSRSRAIPSFPSQVEWKIGLAWANTRGSLNSPS